ncbi:hypothetical protein Mycch_0805 [Mycolicibacterium chubuense NBB4]|uniref:Uncharacterized protein n=1 Tax=Mycolicibacterium chubuense (strain NBB4) TaxID=710421 RepID=I4BEB4_MYCCN|nr:hypothetical protein [Mycolicibacterium chubuense]AFM15621.1 hypothetical protein Mycch_0805 [Mycolicibacterium chubuense NBB4]
MRIQTFGTKVLAASALTVGLSGLAIVGDVSASAQAAPLQGGFSVDKPWWHDDHHNRDWYRDGRWDGGHGCISASGPNGQITASWCT